MNDKFTTVSYLLESDLFRSAMSGPREKGKKYVKRLSETAMNEVKDELEKDLKKKYEINSIEMKLGKFRGYQYISSCKIALKPKNSKFKKDSQVADLLKYLQDTYSPKFKLNSIDEEGMAHLNVR